MAGVSLGWHFSRQREGQPIVPSKTSMRRFGFDRRIARIFPALIGRRKTPGEAAHIQEYTNAEFAHQGPRCAGEDGK